MFHRSLVVLLVVFASTLFLLSGITAAPTHAAKQDGTSPETAYQLGNLNKTPATFLKEGTETWFTFDFGYPSNFDKTQLTLDFAGLVSQTAVNRDLAYNLETFIYDPANVNAFLKARRNQEKLPKPVGSLFPYKNSNQDVQFWTWDDGDRSGVDLANELCTGCWLVRVRNNSTFNVTGKVIRFGYYKNSVHPDVFAVLFPPLP